MIRGAAIAALLVAVLVLGPSVTAVAAPLAEVALVVVGDCPDEAAVSLALAAVLPGTRIAPGAAAAPGVAEIVVTDLGRGYRVAVAADRRELDEPARDCAERARVAALLAGLPLGPANPDAPPGAASATDGVPVESGRPGSPTAGSIPGAASAARARREVRVDLALEVAATSQPTTIDAGVGGMLRLRVARRSVGAVVGLGGYSPLSLRIPSTSGEVRVSLLRFPVDLGFDLSGAFRRVELSGQIGPTLVPFIARGLNLADNRAGNGFDVGGRLGGELRVPIGRGLAAGARAGADAHPLAGADPGDGPRRGGPDPHRLGGRRRRNFLEGPLKVPDPGAHSHDVPAAPRRLSLVPPPASRGFEGVYRAYFGPCCRWLQAMGMAEGEIEDVAQEVFLVVERKLAEAAVENLASWIYVIARNTASDRRRRAFWRRLWLGRSELSGDEPATGPSPLEDVERRERVNEVRALLDRLPRKRRTALVLFELHGYSGEEIAALEGVPVATIWTRLHHARRQFVALATAERAMEEEP